MRDGVSKNPAVRLLLISDNSKEILPMRMMLAEIKGAVYELVAAKDMREGLRQLGKQKFGMVFLDLTIKGNKGLAALLDLEKQAKEIPIVILTAREEQSLALDAVKKGAQDYLVKGKLDANVLARVIHYGMERHRAMREMLEKNRELERLSALKSEFVSTVSHELRTPLTVILSTSNNLIDGAIGILSEEQRKWVRKINGHAMRLHDMINDILDLSKLQSGRSEMRPSLVSVPVLIHNTVESLLSIAHEKGMEINVAVATSLPDLWADRSRLEQVLTNLISNAVKYAPPKSEIRVNVKEAKDGLVFSVKDSGPGIAREHHESIFERFRQLRESEEADKATQGIGLGLAISKEIVNLHNGRIWVESEPGKGSCFSFQIPINQAPARAQAA